MLRRPPTKIRLDTRDLEWHQRRSDERHALIAKVTQSKRAEGLSTSPAKPFPLEPRGRRQPDLQSLRSEPRMPSEQDKPSTACGIVIDQPMRLNSRLMWDELPAQTEVGIRSVRISGAPFPYCHSISSPESGVFPPSPVSRGQCPAERAVLIPESSAQAARQACWAIPYLG